jgi:hypothetical protein
MCCNFIIIIIIVVVVVVVVVIIIIKAIPVTGLEGLQSCEMFKIPYSLDNQLIDGGTFVSPTHRPLFTPQKHYFFNVSGTHFC